MRIGVPREIKPDEHRVGLSPAAVRELVAHGHEVVVQPGAGEGSGFPDAAYEAAGARLAADAEDVFRGAQLIDRAHEADGFGGERGAGVHTQRVTWTRGGLLEITAGDFSTRSLRAWACIVSRRMWLQRAIPRSRLGRRPRDPHAAAQRSL